MNVSLYDMVFNEGNHVCKFCGKKATFITICLKYKDVIKSCDQCGREAMFEEVAEEIRKSETWHVSLEKCQALEKKGVAE